MDFAQQIMGLLAWLLFLAGCVLLHLRVRSPSSLSFLLSIGSCAVWAMWAQSVFWHNFPVAPQPSGANALIGLGRPAAIAETIEATLMLWAAGSFFLAVKAIRRLIPHAV